MLTRKVLRTRIEEHLDGFTTVADLAAWAEEVFRAEEFEPEHSEQISQILSVIRDTTDPHRFRWEEPDFEQMLIALSD
ncbi:MAG: hypothetical protein ACE5FJ_11610 [Gemmatimonadales bacterium]